MLSAQQVASVLGYSESEHWVSAEVGFNDHLLRRAREAGVIGTYVFQTSPADYRVLPHRSAVHIAQATTLAEAREIHRSLWNLGDAPFLIIVLPSEVRVYTGFKYDTENDNPLQTVATTSAALIAAGLAEFHASQIDSGRIWDTWGKRLPVNERVDHSLLRDLNILGEQLIDSHGLEPEVAHSLIGKYIYIRYLRERDILSDRWLTESGVDIARTLGRNATLSSFRQLVNAIEQRFNGRVFPLPLEGDNAPQDDAVSYVASVLLGDSPEGQLSIIDEYTPDFKIYDFSYIPVELLSSIYEQFLHAQGGGRKSGAFYTPEPVAEYLLSEVNEFRPLRKGLRILDPCCGSGVFLVLAYRRLIEAELRAQPDGKLRPSELRRILTESIFGVERNQEACYVTEFSLLLTMLSYIDPPELHRNKQFEFPVLHNTQIFEQDFFNLGGPVWSHGTSFDWIVGNPPWVELDPRDADERFAVSWITENASIYPVARFRTSEAFCWLVTELLSETGCVGLLVHATTLSNDSSRNFRREFFTRNHVAKVTNFSNLSYVLFDRRAEAPAATLIYAPDQPSTEPKPTVHFGPFVANQLPIRTQLSKRSWVITVYENEISVIDRENASSGDALVWKMALWGSYRDKTVLGRMRRLFTTTVQELAGERGCSLALGVQLRTSADDRSGEDVFCSELETTRVLDPDIMNASKRRFTIPSAALKDNACTYIRARGGRKGLRLIKAPHLVVTPIYAAYSEEDFVLTHPRIGIAGKSSDADFLRALSVYLNSNIAKYLAFFGSTSWGVDRTSFVLSDVADIPIPQLSDAQIAALAVVHKSINEEPRFLDTRDEEQLDLTEIVAKILGLPENITYLADEFVTIRLGMNKGKVDNVSVRAPETSDLTAYGQVLTDELNSFADLNHRVTLYPSKEFVCCAIDLGGPGESDARPVIVDSVQDVSEIEPIWKLLRSAPSQWVYVQRSLRIFDGDRVVLVKASRRIDWTRMQALLDSDDIIAEVLSQLGRGD
jgi:hypothetical protein